VEALASEYAGKLKVVKLDVDESGDVAGQFGVQSIPTLILFKGGQPVERLVGNVPKPAIVSKIQQYL
jgi:thioredoxin 1